MLRWWLVPHIFQAKIRLGFFKYDLPVKGGIFPPDQYLGANAQKVQLEDGQFVWSKTVFII